MNDFKYKTFEDMEHELGRWPTPEELESEVRSRIEVLNAMADAQADALLEELEAMHEAN